MTQEQLAGHIGISRQHMGGIEAPNMVRAVSLEVLFNIATVLEIEPYMLLKFNPEK
ncbi:MAG: helix-turn-helix transcriptional regulator [Clostridiales bacterium]|nr:helix-turn-helix transcriptional regulator [Clostridiales bacterium]